MVTMMFISVGFIEVYEHAYTKFIDVVCSVLDLSKLNRIDFLVGFISRLHSM